MKEVLNITTEAQWEEDKPQNKFETQVNDYLKKRFPGISIEELYRINMGDIYTWAAIQKKRLVSYLIIKQDWLTIDKILKQSWKTTDYASKLAVFKDYVSKSLIDVKKAGSLNYRGTMEQNLEMLHLLVQELYFGSLDSSLSSSQLRELKKDVAAIKEQPIVSAKPKKLPIKDQKLDNRLLTWNRDFTIIAEPARTDYLVSLASAVFDQKWQVDNQTVNSWEWVIPASLQIVNKNEWINVVREKIVKWINPKMMPIEKFSKNEIRGKCSRTARLYLGKLWINPKNILQNDSIVLIDQLRKRKTWKEYRADKLTEELLRRMSEWKGNVYDSYFDTPLWHRAVLFIWSDNELYVIDPFFADKGPVKIMDYTLSTSPQWIRKVIIPNIGW